MTDSVAVFSVIDRVTDANGDPVSGGSVEFYEAGTSTAKTVYSNATLATSLGSTVTLDSGGYPVSGGSTKTMIYTGTAAYKVIVKDADGTTLITHDNVPGAVTIPTNDEIALPETPVVSRTTTYQILSTDQGKLINADPTGGSFAITLPNALTVGDSWLVGVRHSGSSTNAVAVRSLGGQTIGAPGQASATSIALTGLGHTMWFVSDGAGWSVDAEVPSLMSGGLPHFRVTDRLTAPPASPTGGARYIINGSPTGAWSTLSFAENQVVESDGNGSWLGYTPANGWMAWVDDEDVITVFHDSAWEDWSNVTAPSTSALKIAVFSDEKATNTSGGTPVDDTWTTSTLNTTRSNNITGASLASNVITLPTGKYQISAQKSFYAASETQIRMRNTTTSTNIGVSAQGYSSNFVSAGASILAGFVLPLTAYVEVTAATETIELQYYSTVGGVANGLGRVRNIGTENEVYAVVTILDLTSIQGPAGEQGTQGADGLDAAYPYQWSTATSGDPGSGKVLGNSATIASITQINISETDSAGGSMADVLATWDDSTSSVRARLKITKEGATQNFHLFSITGAATDAGTYWTIPVTYVATSGTVANSDNCAVLVVEKGDKGDTGSTGSTGATGAAGATGATGPNTGLDFAWATATSGDPGSGGVLANNGTLASATQINISKTGRNAESLGAVIATWDDSTNTAHYGHLRIFTVADRTEYIEAEITGTLTDNSTYYAVPVSVTAANGTPSANDVMAVMFERTGNKGTNGAGSGDVVGPASATDGGFAKFDGTTGKLIKDSAAVIVVADGGTGRSTGATAYGLIAAGTTATGAQQTLAAGATTEVLVGGGAAALPVWTTATGSGAPVRATSPTLVTPALGTPASGTLTNATGLPISTGVSGLGTGVATFLGTPSSANLAAAVTDETGSGALVFATSPSLVTPALGTPTSGTLTNATGLPISTGVSGLGTGVATFLATPSSANLAAAVTDETGSGALVFGTSPNFTTSATIDSVPIYTNIPQNSQSAAYTLVLGDAQKHILHPIADNNARTFTIPANSSVAYPTGTAITFINLINTVTIAITTDTMYLAGAGTTGSRTLAAYGTATALKVASTTWIISGSGLT